MGTKIVFKAIGETSWKQAYKRTEILLVSIGFAELLGFRLLQTPFGV